MKRFIGTTALLASVGALLFVSAAEHAAILVSHDEDESRDPLLQSSSSSMTFSEDARDFVHDHSESTDAYDNDNLKSISTREVRQRRRQLRSSTNGDANNPDCPERNNPAQSHSIPQLPNIPLLQQSYYAASFPGTSDKLFSKTLVEQLTGLHVGNASTSPSLHKMTALDQYNMLGQGEVIALRTHFPHPKGKLSSWDENIPKAYVILRNPLDVMSEYFDEVYQNSHHLLGSSNKSNGGSSSNNKEEKEQYAQASKEAWIKWRDNDIIINTDDHHNQLQTQIQLYQQFISFWLERYLGKDVNRIFLSYEELMEGPEEVVRLARFLEEGIRSNVVEMAAAVAAAEEGESSVNLELFGGHVDEESIAQATDEAMKRMVRSQDIPCLWKSVIQNHHEESERNSRKRKKQAEKKVEGNTNFDEERPYTAQNLMEISQMLLKLMNRYSKHRRLWNILSRYHRDVTLMYQEVAYRQEQQQREQQSNEEVQSVDESQTKNDPQVKQKHFHIFQASPPGTGGTFLTNWLMGIFEPQKEVAQMERPDHPVIQNGRSIPISSTIVTKTNYLDLLHLYKTYRPLFDEVLFVISMRKADFEGPVLGGACDYKNVLCIEPEELVYYNREDLPEVIRSLTNQFRNRFRYFFGKGSEWLSFEREETALVRLDAMSKAAADLAGQPLEVMHGTYGIFGQGTAAQSQHNSRRRLSNALPNGGCEITWPQPPQKPYETAYAASYPGCGARMTWNLVEALTGLWTGDDWDSNNRGKRVVTIKTHYPHDAGKLVSWDDEIHRALVIIRNPMHAIPSFFNHIYEMKNHLPVHSQRAPVDAWIEWRDRLAAIQISRFEKFVDYWMERFLQLNDNRIFVSYERLTSDDLGAEEAIRITRFLGQSEGVTPIDIESVPCVWKSVVKYKESLKASNEPAQQRRRLDPMHHDSQRSGPTERPYTPELLSSMSDMLLRLIQKWGDNHLRLRKVLEGYHEDVAAALAAIGNSDSAIASLGGVAPAMQPQQKNFHVILACPEEMDCTILSNVLIGLFEPPDAYLSFMEDSSQLQVRHRGSLVSIESSVVTMTNDMNLLAMYKTMKPQFDEVYFVAPVKGEACEYENVMCVDNEALVYSDSDGMEDVVTKIAKRLRHHFFEDSTVLSEEKLVVALNRLVNMESLRSGGTQVAILEEKFGIRGGVGGAAADNAVNKMSAPLPASDKAPLIINGKTYHIFQASPPHTASTVLNNFLIGMFEPGAEYSFMVYNKERTIRRHDKDVAIDDGHIVTKTHILDLMGLYKQYRNTFDEILFVVANRGVNPETRVDSSLCQYNNVLCVEYEELLYSDEHGREMVVRRLAAKLKDRFNYFFGDHLDLMDSFRLNNAVTRLQQMDEATASMADQPFTVSDNMFGVHGGHRNRDGSEMLGSSTERSDESGKLFYCGGAPGLNRKEFKYSTFGLFLANTLFPEFEGKVEYQPGQPLINTAIPLTEETLNQATANDILIMHSHQKCEILSLAAFPGRQLHVNAEFYDMHPLHLLNPNGEFTQNYLPPGERSYIIGPHEDTRRSIRIPYCSMKLWYLHKTRPTESILPKIIDPSQKPQNTKEHFLLYINSHYIEYRERAARALSEIGTIHTAGKCQGNWEIQPPPKPDGSPEQCEPFEDSLRPPSILPVSASSDRDAQGQNSNLFSKYRFALVMENADAPGYVSEKILDAFLAGSIPVYFGSRMVFDVFNPRAFVFFDLDIPQQALGQIQFLEQNPSEYERMLNEPIIANEEVLEKYFSWDETVGNGALKQRIRHMMGLPYDIIE